jgi:hypothetical protein
LFHDTQENPMNKLVATLIAGTLASVSTAALAQSAAPTPSEKGKAAAYANPAAQATAEEKAKAGMATVEKTKSDPKAAQPNLKDPATMEAQQALTKSGTNPAQAKANVEASKKVAKKKPTNVKDMTPEERAAWRKQLQEQSKP